MKDEKAKLQEPRELDFWFGQRRQFQEICPTCLTRGSWLRAAWVCLDCKRILGA